jgi:hypothetical protein
VHRNRAASLAGPTLGGIADTVPAAEFLANSRIKKSTAGFISDAMRSDAIRVADSPDRPGMTQVELVRRK